MNIPAITYSGTGTLFFRSISAGTSSTAITLTGHLVSTSLIIVQTASNAMTFNTGNYNITATAFSIGNNSTNTSTFNFGSSTINCRSLSNYIYLGTATINLQYSIWTLTTSQFNSSVWTNYSGWTVNPGNSSVTFNGLGTTTITSAGKSFYDVAFDSTVIVAVVADALSVRNFNLINAQSYSQNGAILTASGDVTFGGAGDYNFGTGITMTGASASLHIASTIQYPSSTACVVTMDGTTGMTVTDDYGVIFKKLVLGTDATVINSGLEYTTYKDTSEPLIFTDGGTLTANKILSFRVSGDGNSHSILGRTPTINGNNTIFFEAVAQDSTMSVPALTYSGTNTVIIRGNSIGLGNIAISLAGDITSTSLWAVSISANPLYFKTNGHAIIAPSNIAVGNNSTAQASFDFGSSTVRTKAFSYNTFPGTGPSSVNLGSSTWYLTANQYYATVWENLSDWTFNPGTSSLNFGGIGTATVSSAGKPFNDITVDSTDLTFYFDENVTLNNFTVKNTAYYSINGYDMTASGNVTFGGPESVNLGNAITMTGQDKTLKIFGDIGAVSGGSCALTFLNDGTYQNDYGATTKSFTLGSDATVLIDSSNSTICKFTGANTLISLGANSYLKQDTRLFLTANGACTMFSFAPGALWTDCGKNYLHSNVNIFNNSGATVYLPTVNYTGSGNGYWFLSSTVNTTCTTSYTGDWLFGEILFTVTSDANGTGVHTINFNNNNFSFDNLKVGNNADYTNNSLTVNYGDSTFSLRTFDITNNDIGVDYGGPTTQNFENSHFIIGALGQYEFDWYFSANHIINPGTFSIDAESVDANAPFHFTSGGHSFYDIYLNVPGRRFWAVGDMSCHNLTVNQGIWSNNGYTLSVSGDASFLGKDTLNLSNGITMTGNSATLYLYSLLSTITADTVTFTGNDCFLTVNNNEVVLSKVTVGDTASLTVNGAGDPFNITGTGILVSVGANAVANWNQVTNLNPADNSDPIEIGPGGIINNRVNLRISAYYLDNLILAPGSYYNFRTDTTTVILSFSTGDWAGTDSSRITLNSDTTGVQAAVKPPYGISFSYVNASNLIFDSTKDMHASSSAFYNVRTSGHTVLADEDSTNLGDNSGVYFPAINYFIETPYITYPNVAHYDRAPYANDYPYTSILDTSRLLGLTNYDPYFDNFLKFSRIDVLYNNGRQTKVVSHFDGTGAATWSASATEGLWKKIGVRCVDKDGAELRLNSTQLKSSENLPVLSAPYPYVAPNFYVEGLNGNDSNDGLSINTAFKTLQKGVDAAQPGSTVYVLDTTTYTSYPQYEGDSHNYPMTFADKTGLPGYYITVKPYSGRPKIFNGTSWSGIKVEGASSYICVEGFEVIGNRYAVDYSYAYAHKDDLNNYRTSHAGISIQKNIPDTGRYPHHIIVKNNVVHDNAGAGIGGMNGDYISILNNVVYNNANWSPYAESAITVGFLVNYDKADGYHNYIMGNTCYDNQEFIPFYEVGYISDGNGIIIDSLRPPRNSLGNYVSKTLVANNLCFNNGGRGITVFASNFVDVINNTTYHNAISGLTSDNEGVDSETSTNQTSGCKYLNNVFYARPDRTVTDYFGTDATFNYNVYNSDSPFNRGYPHTMPMGPNDLSGVNFFVNASDDPALANFRTTGIGHNDGTTFLAVSTDILGVPRVAGSYDRGAYEA